METFSKLLYSKLFFTDNIVTKVSGNQTSDVNLLVQVTVLYVPYSKKLWREKSLANLANHFQFVQVFFINFPVFVT